MAVYNEIGIGRWNRFIQKLTDIKGGPPARQLASEIVFSHGIFSGEENRYLESWDRFGVGLANGPIVAQQAGIRLTNPTGSNVIAVVEKALVSVVTAEVINLEYGNVGAALSNVAIGIPMENRGRSAPTCIPSFNAGALTTLNVVASATIAATTPFDFVNDGIQEICLPPGVSVQIDGNTVNSQIFVSWFWRERFLEPAERK